MACHQIYHNVYSICVARHEAKRNENQQKRNLKANKKSDKNKTLPKLNRKDDFIPVERFPTCFKTISQTQLKKERFLSAVAPCNSCTGWQSVLASTTFKIKRFREFSDPLSLLDLENVFFLFKRIFSDTFMATFHTYVRAKCLMCGQTNVVLLKFPRMLNCVEKK